MSNIWVKAAVIRAIKTMAQSAIAIIGTATVISDVDWKVTVSAVVVSGILSILTSVAGLPEVDMITEDDIEVDATGDFDNPDEDDLSEVEDVDEEERG